MTMTRDKESQETRINNNKIKRGKKSRPNKKIQSYFDENNEMDDNRFEPLISRRYRKSQKRRSHKRKGPHEFLDQHVVKRSSNARESTEIYQGLVIEASSNMCRVDINGVAYLCDIRGSIKENQSGYVNSIAVGDRVEVLITNSGRGVVDTILPRKSVLTRPYSPDQGKIIGDLQQIVVANVDRLLIVSSWREPFIWPALIDRYLIAARRNNLEAVICINKVDLIDNSEEFHSLVSIYKNLGYSVIQTSAISSTGIEEIKNILKMGMTVLTGLSGVGKSSLLITVEPGLKLKIGNVSEHGLYKGQGRHTTTLSRLFKLDNGGVVVDTPGVRSFALAGISPLDLATWYPEMKPYISECRFSNCTHIHESECGVISALKDGNISDVRYKNYTQIFDELTTTIR